MHDIPGIIKPTLSSLPRIKDRNTFVYLEHCVINRENGAITVTDNDGIVHIPSAQITVLLLGPGCNITHRAMELIGDTGVGVVWVGEHGVRYYAHGRSLNSHSRLLLQQASLVTNVRSHAAVVRKMYQMRFPNEDVSSLTIQQLRGREGTRVRNIYSKMSTKYGIEWNGREFSPDDFDASDLINQALSAANVCLYGLAHAVIVSMGCSPALGFVHVGHELSFVYDIADLYKADLSIPVAFEITSKKPEDLSSSVRHAMRDAMIEYELLEKMVRDIKSLLSKDDNDGFLDNRDESAVYLWDDKLGEISNGKNFGI